MGNMRATLRLITVWVSVTIVIVFLGWSGLRTAVIAAMHGDTDGFTTLNPSALGNRPGTAWSGSAGGGDDTLAPRLAPRSTPPAAAVKPPRPGADHPAQPVQPVSSSSPPPQAPAAVESPPASLSPTPVVQKPDPQPTPDAVTTVRTDGGTVLLRNDGKTLAVEDVQPARGFSARAMRSYDGALLLHFVSSGHVSRVYAYVDAEGCPQVTIEEQDR
jgi:hypothetical protein